MLRSWLLLVIGWFPVVAVAFLLSVFIFARRWRELPLFFLYLVTALLVVGARYLSFHLGLRPYFYTYWITDLLMSVVAFMPMYEVFLRRLFKGFHRNSFYRSIFPIVAILILVLAVLTAMQASDKRAAFQMASRAFDFMRTAVLVFFVALMMLMGREWTRYDLGITLGFSIQAAVALANSAVRVRVHYAPTVMDTVENVAYNISCIIWCFTFIKLQRPASAEIADSLDPEVLKQARSWQATLKDWLTAGKGKR